LRGSILIPGRIARRLCRGGAWALLVTSLAVAGCHKGRIIVDEIIWGEHPLEATPQQTMRSLESSWSRRSTDAYQVLFTQDYRFAFSALDPYGNAYRGDTWTRDDEMIFAGHLFLGGHPTEPRATSISLELDHNFTVRDDPRPGKNPRWHKTIRTSLALAVVDSSKETVITGFGNFYLVRGDSALVPSQIVWLGYAADSTHWYIDRWEDDTAMDYGQRTMPTKNATVGQLKALYR
jgi:hypothetical protein